ncbi:MAG: LamG domain-containing protein, partial [Planctomycetota bacterium]
PWKGYLWEFTTEAGKARDPDPADRAGFQPEGGITLGWTSSCLAASGDYLYFSADFNDVNTSNISVRSGPIHTSESPTGALAYATKYYWKVNAVGGSTEGDVWSFQTDGYPLMHYEFDGVLDANVHDPFDANVLTDSTGNVTFDLAGGDGELRYGETNPLYNTGGTSAHFTPYWDPNDDDDNGSGRYLRRHCFGADLLDLDGPAYTIEAWVRQDGPAAGVRDGDLEGTIIRKDYGSYGLGIDDDGAVKFMHSGEHFSSEDTGVLLTLGEWHHIAAVYDETEPNQTERIYINGLVVADNNSPARNPVDDNDDIVGIGAFLEREPTQLRVQAYFNGAIDELRVIALALTPSEFLIRGDRGLAWLPRPYNYATEVPYDANLLWEPGDLATSHDVYFGTDYNEVSDANTNDFPVYKGPQEPCEYEPGILDLATTYYWRIDERDDSNGYTWTGSIWRFATADYIVIDDFESYIGETVYLTWWEEFLQWPNSSGAALFLSAEALGGTVHSGEQATRYQYDTDSGWPKDYAVAWLQYDPAMDWKTSGVRLLTLFFYGTVGNDITDLEQMFVRVEDSDNLYAEMRYGDNEYEDANDINDPEWHQWAIPLAYFNDSNFAEIAADVNFASIYRFYLGFGDMENPVKAGSGTVYFDDIRLSLPTCIPEFTVYDLSGDCEVGYADVGIMMDQWLDGDVNFVDLLGGIQEPCDANLVGWWEFDEGSGSTASDSSSYNHPGTLETNDVNVYWVTGHNDVDYALEFDGGRVRVPDHEDLRPLHEVSVCAWI